MGLSPSALRYYVKCCCMQKVASVAPERDYFPFRVSSLQRSLSPPPCLDLLLVSFIGHCRFPFFSLANAPAGANFPLLDAPLLV